MGRSRYAGQNLGTGKACRRRTRVFLRHAGIVLRGAPSRLCLWIGAAKSAARSARRRAERLGGGRRRDGAGDGLWPRSAPGRALAGGARRSGSAPHDPRRWTELARLSSCASSSMSRSMIARRITPTRSFSAGIKSLNFRRDLPAARPYAVNGGVESLRSGIRLGIRPAPVSVPIVAGRSADPHWGQNPTSRRPVHPHLPDPIHR